MYTLIATDIHLLIDYLKGCITFLRIKMPPTVTICVRSYLSTSFHDLTSASGTLIANGMRPPISPANDAGDRGESIGACRRMPVNDEALRWILLKCPFIFLISGSILGTTFVTFA